MTGGAFVGVAMPPQVGWSEFEARTSVLLMEFPGALLESDFAELVRMPSVRQKLVNHDKYFARRLLKKC